MALNITLYQSTAPRNKLDKSGSLSAETNMTASYYMEQGQNSFAPVLAVNSTTLPSYNYCYISDWRTYYFVDNIDWISHNTWKLSLYEDVLNTFKTKIRNVYGRCVYSDLGDGALVDNRLSYRTTPYIYSNTINVETRTRTGVGNKVAVRIFNGTAPECTETWLMTYTDFRAFMNGYWALTEKEKVVFGKAVEGIYLVNYIPDSNIPYEIVSPIGGQVEVEVYFKTSEEEDPTASVFFTPTSTVYRVQNRFDQDIRTEGIGSGVNYILYSSPLQYAWELSAGVRIEIPYIGCMAFSLNDLGISVGNTAYQIGLAIKVDLLGMQYIAYPRIRRESGWVEYPDMMKTAPITTVLPFPVDTNVANWAAKIGGSAVSIIGSAVTGGALIASGAGIPAGIAMIGTSVVSNGINLAQNAKQDAMGYGASGGNGSSSPYNVLTYRDGSAEFNKMTIKIFMYPPVDRINTAPFVSYWENFGIPDGHYRKIGDLPATYSGYFLFDDFILQGFDTATTRELDEIERLLKEGCYL